MNWIEHSLDGFFPPVASSYGGDIDFVFNFVFWIVVAFWFMLAQAAFFYLVMRYRKQDGRQGAVHHRRADAPSSAGSRCRTTLIIAVRHRHRRRRRSASGTT